MDDLLLTHRIKPEHGLYLAKDDHLHLAVYSSASSQVVTFSGYTLNSRGEISPWSQSIAPTSDRAATTATRILGECFLLSCVAVLSSGNAFRGQTYVRVRIQKSSGTPATPYATVLAGYITDEYCPSFPGGKHEGPLEGPGNIRSITGTNPAAGVEITETVPTGAAWRPLSLIATLVCDATVATRRGILLFDDGTTTHTRMPQNTTLTANQTAILSWHIGSDIQSSGGVFGNCPMANHVRLPAAHRILTTTNNIAAGDNWSAPQLLVEEWLEA